MGTQLKDLAGFGQSIWLDNIRRSMFASGELQRLIDQGLRGMTSNPTIFEKAIGSGNDYDAQLGGLIATERDATTLFEALAIDDIRHACDLFRPVYDATNGLDGYVSLEVSPTLAHNTQSTIEAAERLWNAVGRANVMIKIPGTVEGVPAIKATIGKGINVNVTLLFSVDRYEAAANAYIEGLEERAAQGQPIDRIASVASVFVSRIDSAVDKLLHAKIDSGEPLESLLGEAAIANSKLIYQRFLALFHGERFEKLRAKGAHVQRPLWASTSTKNPAYPDLIYVENLVAKDTVNTVPPATLEAVLDHGHPQPETILRDLDGARRIIDRLAKAKISLYDVTESLVREGVDSFAKSFEAMLDAIRTKQTKLAEGSTPRVDMSLGAHQAAADAALQTLTQNDFLNKLVRHDPSPWSTDPAHVAIIKNALGWVDIAQQTHAQTAELRDFAATCAKKFDHVVVLGMGGSSLAPDVFRATFGRVNGFPQLHVLDSTDPVQIKALEGQLDLARSLFIVASKSGTTTEPDAFFRYFYERVQKSVGSDKADLQFVAITDPGTKLEEDARAHGFLRIFTNAPDIGGRYSALSYFGIVPAALAGYDVAAILDRAINAMHANAQTMKVGEAPGVQFGAAIGSLAKNGVDKLTIVTHPAVAAYGAWAEQLIAESTGKSGTGIVPIEGEPLGAPESYGKDRLFAYVGAGLPNADASAEAQLDALEKAGHPVIRLRMDDTLDIGDQMYTWEIATAAAGSVLGIDAFDQPNVQESKDNTKRILAEYTKTSRLPEPAPALDTEGFLVFPVSGTERAALGNDLNSAVAALVGQVEPRDYVAFTAYMAMNDEHQATLRDLRVKVRDGAKVATTVGFGPRFLHSTGQLHKGGSNEGVFMQLTHDAPFDLQIPGMVGFRTLQRAQALGDFESLDSRNRRGLRIHIQGDLAQGLRRLGEALDVALTSRV